MAKVLTTKSVNAAKSSEERRELPDGGLTGLYLVVQPSGAKSWAVRYRLHGKPKKMVLGKYPIIGLSEARDKASEALRMLDEGTDPSVARKAARAVAEEDERDLFENVLTDFIEKYAKRKNRSWRETDRILRREPLGAWRGRSIESIRRRDVIALLDSIVDRAPTMANRTFAAVRKTFAWCVERDIIEFSPCSGLRPPAPEVRRDRVLNDAELTAVWRAASDLGYPFGPVIHLLILTGQRREEVAQARWAEFDLQRGVWTIPARRAKNAVEHVVPLSPQAMTILRGLPRNPPTKEGGRPFFLFTTTGDTPVSGFTRAKRRLDAGMLDCLTAAGGDQVVVPWRIHDLRRTVATGMAAIGVALPVVEKIMNHVSGSFGGIVGVYQRHDYAAEKRIALESWAAKLVAEGCDCGPGAGSGS